MLLLPIETEGHKQDTLIVVLDDTNLERMRRGDPAEIKLKEISQQLVRPVILLCYEKITPEFNCLIQSGDIKRILVHLQRAWKYRPDLGDHDRGPESIKDSN